MTLTSSRQRPQVVRLSRVGAAANRSTFQRSLLFHLFAWSILGAALTPLYAGNTNNIMLTGYWPPTNEMVRHFSDSPTQNPKGWQGLDWEGRGYNIYSYFPEFVDFPNQPIGVGDFEVDYQDTSADWWRIVEQVKPVAIITFSRTTQFPIGWEVELRQRNLMTWANDYLAPLQPTPAPPDSSVPAGTIRFSTLPAQEIVDAVRAEVPGVNPRIDTTSFGGGFLSEFIAYHGVWYHDIHAMEDDPFRNVAAGHIHVGGNVTVAQGRAATEVTLRQVIARVDQILMVPEPIVSALVLCLLGLGFARRSRG
ncbi:MAG TPA: hypothetical protein VIY86_11295 [Pirellulaceae bacterium]